MISVKQLTQILQLNFRLKAQVNRVISGPCDMVGLMWLTTEQAEERESEKHVLINYRLHHAIAHFSVSF